MKLRLGLLWILIACICSGCSDEKVQQNDTSSSTCEVFAMDTYMTLTADGENVDKALNEAKARIEELDNILSTGNEESEIALLNKTGSGELSEDSFYLLEKSLEISDKTDGAFLPTIYPLMEAWGFPTKEFNVPEESTIESLLPLLDVGQVEIDSDKKSVSFKKAGMKLDFGGIAKGYTSDEIMKIFKENGIESGIVNLGGNVHTLGTKADGSLWKVGIQNPSGGEDYLGVLEIADKAVITSGGYERYFEEDGIIYHHIIDPDTGFPADNELQSVTIVSDNGLLADGLSTALFVMGLDKAIDFWRNNNTEFDVIMMTKDNVVYVSEGISDSFSTSYDMKLIER